MMAGGGGRGQWRGVQVWSMGATGSCRRTCGGGGVATLVFYARYSPCVYF